MNVSWVAASKYVSDAAVDVEKIKSIGPVWGSQSTWRSCETDNVVCHDVQSAEALVARQFHQRCNFYTYKNNYQLLGRPQGIYLYDNTVNFDIEVDCIDDVIAMHLAAARSDVVLLLGFDFARSAESDDRYNLHKVNNWHRMVRGCIAQNTETQWVAVDHCADFDEVYTELSNLTCDKMTNVLKLLLQ